MLQEIWRIRKMGNQEYLSHYGRPGMKWGYNDGRRNGKDVARGIDELRDRSVNNALHIRDETQRRRAEMKAGIYNRKIKQAISERPGLKPKGMVRKPNKDRKRSLEEIYGPRKSDSEFVVKNSLNPFEKRKTLEEAFGPKQKKKKKKVSKKVSKIISKAKGIESGVKKAKDSYRKTKQDIKYIKDDINDIKRLKKAMDKGGLNGVYEEAQRISRKNKKKILNEKLKKGTTRVIL